MGPYHVIEFCKQYGYEYCDFIEDLIYKVDKGIKIDISKLSIMDLISWLYEYPAAIVYVDDEMYRHHHSSLYTLLRSAFVEFYTVLLDNWQEFIKERNSTYGPCNS